MPAVVLRVLRQAVAPRRGPATAAQLLRYRLSVHRCISPCVTSSGSVWFFDLHPSARKCLYTADSVSSVAVAPPRPFSLRRACPLFPPLHCCWPETLCERTKIQSQLARAEGSGSLGLAAVPFALGGLPHAGQNRPRPGQTSNRSLRPSQGRPETILKVSRIIAGRHPTRGKLQIREDA